MFAGTWVLSLILSLDLSARAPVEAATPTAAESAALREELQIYARRSRDTRLAFVASSAITKAALLTTGFILDGRADDVSKSIGVGLIAGGAAPLLFSAMLLAPAGIETVSANAGATNDGPASEEIRRIEGEWMRAAAKGRRTRLIAGTIEIAAGAGLSAAGAYLLLAKGGLWGLTRNGQYEVGSFLIGPGVPIFGVGVRSLLVESLEETSWQAHEARSGTPPPSPPVTGGLVPLRGGFLASLVASSW